MLCAACFFYFTFSISISSIKESREGTEKYKLAAEKLHQSESTSESEETAMYDTYSEIKYTTSEVAEMILEDLKFNGIVPLKYQIIDNSKGIFIEALIKCSNTQFSSYLCEFKEQTYPYTINSIIEKTETDNISVTIRYAISPAKLHVNNSDIDRKSIASLFRPIYKPKPPVELKEIKPEIKIEQIEDTIEDGSKKYRIIGNIVESDGINYLYLKSIDSNRVYKIPEEDIIDNNDSYYVLRMEDNKVKIKKGN